MSPYSVLLVKLDPAGNDMGHAWYLGGFPTRNEQGVLTLQLRASSIGLTDVMGVKDAGIREENLN
jgi:hypothetical protein